MPRSVVGLLAAVGATMFALAAFAHGVLFLLTIADGAAATGLVGYLTAPATKKAFLKSPMSPTSPTSVKLEDGVNVVTSRYTSAYRRAAAPALCITCRRGAREAARRRRPGTDTELP